MSAGGSSLSRQAWLTVISTLAVPWATFAQGDSAPASLVRIESQMSQGSGIVVSLEDGRATIVTASHVIEGAERFHVVFSVAPDRTFPVSFGDDVVGFEHGDDGLAIFRVGGRLPPGLATAVFDQKPALHEGYGQPLTAWGFPGRVTRPERLTGYLSGTKGTRVLVDRPTAEGASGGPLLRDNMVVGLVYAVDGQFTYAVNSEVVLTFLAGWQISRRASVGLPVKAHDTLPGRELDRAHKLYKRRDYAEAFPIFLQLAKEGNAIAMFYTGRFYRRGHIEQSDEKAALWFGRALTKLRSQTEMGDVFGMYYLGRMYSNGYATKKDKGTALFWYRRAADEGYAKAMFRIGEIRLNQGRYQEALEWFEKSLAAGDPQARRKIREVQELL